MVYRHVAFFAVLGLSAAAACAANGPETAGSEQPGAYGGRPTYAGREPDAAWRRAALARIEQIRKGDLRVKVSGADARPVAGATVDVTMVRHAYAFGSAVAAHVLLRDSDDARTYRGHITNLFNRVVMENDLKWPEWEHESGRAKEAVAWLRGHGVEVRGHCLVWPSWKNTPWDLRGLKDRPDDLRKRVADHIRSEVSGMRGQLVEWDVINEPQSNHDIMDVLGRPVMIDWFKLAHEADPAPRLFLNDYPLLGSGAGHFAEFEKTLRFLKDGGAPIGGIGIQCHYGGRPVPPERLLAGLDQLAQLRLPVEATEFDVDTGDEELQADYVRDHLIAFYSHPATLGVIMWGFWESAHWRPKAALWRRDWSIKPAGKVWTDLVKRQWWTNAGGRTDSTGTMTVRGFVGDYEITVRAGDRVSTVRASLPREGAVVRVVLP